jgi:hypothetical protein
MVFAPLTEICHASLRNSETLLFTAKRLPQVDLAPKLLRGLRLVHVWPGLGEGPHNELHALCSSTVRSHPAQ